MNYDLDANAIIGNNSCAVETEKQSLNEIAYVPEKGAYLCYSLGVVPLATQSEYSRVTTKFKAGASLDQQEEKILKTMKFRILVVSLMSEVSKTDEHNNLLTEEQINFRKIHSNYLRMFCNEPSKLVPLTRTLDEIPIIDILVDFSNPKQTKPSNSKEKGINIPSQIARLFNLKVEDENQNVVTYQKALGNVKLNSPKVNMLKEFANNMCVLNLVYDNLTYDKDTGGTKVGKFSSFKLSKEETNYSIFQTYKNFSTDLSVIEKVHKQIFELITKHSSKFAKYLEMRQEEEKTEKKQETKTDKYYSKNNRTVEKEEDDEIPF